MNTNGSCISGKVYELSEQDVKAYPEFYLRNQLGNAEALIRQLGEALYVSESGLSKMCFTKNEANSLINNAMDAFRNWEKEHGE